jgi:antitoxin VapB
MALSIKNPQAEKLAKEVAVESGENMTQAIIHALEERLQRLRRKGAIKELEREIMTISKRCSNIPDLDPRTPDEILGYDQTGGLT